MIYTTQRRLFVYDTWDYGSRLDRVMVECTLSITHCLRLNLQLRTVDLVRTCRISSFCTVAWQLARFQLTRRIARSFGDSWASCYPRDAMLARVLALLSPVSVCLSVTSRRSIGRFGRTNNASCTLSSVSEVQTVIQCETSIRYDTRCYFLTCNQNQLNLPHGTNNQKVEKQKN